MKDLYIFLSIYCHSVTLLFRIFYIGYKLCYTCLADIIRLFSRPQGLTLKGSKLKLKILTS